MMWQIKSAKQEPANGRSHLNMGDQVHRVYQLLEKKFNKARTSPHRKVEQRLEEGQVPID